MQHFLVARPPTKANQTPPDQCGGLVHVDNDGPGLLGLDAEEALETHDRSRFEMPGRHDVELFSAWKSY